MTKIIFAFAFFGLLFSCNSNQNKLELDIIENQDDLSRFSFINSFEQLDGECLNKLSKMVIGFYAKSEGDSVQAIYHFEGDLFPSHYTSEVNGSWEKYAVIVAFDDTTETFFFAIEKRISTLHFLHHLKVFDILTVDYHMSYGDDFQFLNDCGFAEIKELEYPELVQGKYLDAGSFDPNENNLWVIDSVVKTKQGTGLFEEIQSFYVIEEDKKMISDKETLSYYLKNYSFFIERGEDTLSHRILSFSGSHRILIDDDNKNYIFLSRHKRK